MAAPVLLILRVIQLAFTITVLGLSGYVAHFYNTDTLTSPPTEIGWLIFASTWSLISIVYLELTPRFAPRASHPYASISLEFTNLAFFFGGFIALSVFMSRLLFCHGTVCGVAKADIAVSATTFLTWVGTAILLAKDIFKSGLNFRRGPPAPSGVAKMEKSELP